MNNPDQEMTGGSGGGAGGYGVTSTNIGKSKLLQVPQIDPSQALAYFQQAGSAQTAAIQKGMDAFNADMATAAKQITDGYQQANNTLGPLSSASNAALTQELMMMGITPQAATASYGSQLLNIMPTLTATANLINQANAEADPVQRAALQQQITQQLTTTGTSGVSVAQAAITALGPSAPVAPDVAVKETIPGTGIIMPWNYLQAQDQQKANQATLTSNYNTSLATDQAALKTAQQQQADLNQFSNQFNQNYTPTLLQGYTGAQAGQILSNTPGYQFQLQQGDQQVLRNQAATGGLMTGNTAIALDTFGQNLAANTYNTYMGNLANIVNQGSGATTQIAANQANQAGYLSNISQTTAANTQQQQDAIGAAQAGALNNQGSASYNAAAYNAGAQNTVFNNVMMAQANQQAQAMNLAGSLTNSAQNTANQNQAGLGFYQGMAAQPAGPGGYLSSGSYSSPSSVGSPNNGGL